jgi:hypothetical protein
MLTCFFCDGRNPVSYDGNSPFVPIADATLRELSLATVTVTVIGFRELNRVKVKSIPVFSRSLFHELKQLIAVFIDIWANPTPSETIAQVALAR